MAARILLVEDNTLNRDALMRFLVRRGHEMLIAVDGAEAVQMARERRPDLMLLDLSLPIMDGWEVTRRLRSDALTRSLPIIALSAHALRGDRESALEAGADDFESKPVDVPRLLAKIDALLPAPAAAEAGAPPAPAVLTCRAKREHLPELVGFAVNAARAAGAGDEALHAVRLAVEEVCLNVMTHGYAGGGTGGPLRVAVERRDDALVVQISDEAPPFDPARVPRPRLDASVEERELGGLGWHLVRSVMDDVRHEPAHPVGNVVTLIKRLGQGPAAP
jgi:two-component system cell cycle response regulator DivK